jgi:hypothetical protein
MFDARRLIGRKFDDNEVQADMKHFPFTVFSNSGKPYIRVEYRGEQKELVCLFSIPFPIPGMLPRSRMRARERKEVKAGQFDRKSPRRRAGGK